MEVPFLDLHTDNNKVNYEPLDISPYIRQWSKQKYTDPVIRQKQ